MKRGPSLGEATFAQHLKAYELEATPEFKFHPERKWRFDFAFPECKLAVEVEGATWSAGRHTRGSGFAADCSKYNAAALLGWRVLRFTTDMVKSGQAIDETRKALETEC